MKKFLRLFCIILLVCACGKPLCLSGNDGKIKVWFHDGNSMVLHIKEMPEFQYTDDSFTIYNRNSVYKWPLEIVQKLTFEDIEDIGTDIERVHTGKYESEADVYTLQGCLVARKIPVAQVHKTLPRGIYIIGGSKVVVR